MYVDHSKCYIVYIKDENKNIIPYAVCPDKDSAEQYVAHIVESYLKRDYGLPTGLQARYWFKQKLHRKNFKSPYTIHMFCSDFLWNIEVLGCGFSEEPVNRVYKKDFINDTSPKEIDMGWVDLFRDENGKLTLLKSEDKFIV